MSKTPLNIRLKNARKNSNLTQKDVYEKLDIAQSTYSSWEIGKSEPDADTISTLCGIFGITPNDFMEWESEINLIDFTPAEQNHIKKYRALDEHSRKTVDMILEHEYNRVRKPPDNPETVATIEPDPQVRGKTSLTSKDSKEAG